MVDARDSPGPVLAGEGGHARLDPWSAHGVSEHPVPVIANPSVHAPIGMGNFERTSQGCSLIRSGVSILVDHARDLAGVAVGPRQYLLLPERIGAALEISVGQVVFVFDEPRAAGPSRISHLWLMGAVRGSAGDHVVRGAAPLLAKKSERSVGIKPILDARGAALDARIIGRGQDGPGKVGHLHIRVSGEAVGVIYPIKSAPAEPTAEIRKDGVIVSNGAKSGGTLAGAYLFDHIVRRSDFIEADKLRLGHLRNPRDDGDEEADAGHALGNSRAEVEADIPIAQKLVTIVRGSVAVESGSRAMRRVVIKVRIAAERSAGDLYVIHVVEFEFTHGKRGGILRAIRIV